MVYKHTVKIVQRLTFLIGNTITENTTISISEIGTKVMKDIK